MTPPKAISLAALLFGLLSNANAVENRFSYDVDFARSGNSHSKAVCREDAVTTSVYCSPVVYGPAGDSDATRMMGLSMTRPAGTTTQYLSFRFYADNYFSAGAGGHFSFAVRGAAEFGVYAEGRGMLIGDNSTSTHPTNPALNGCPSRAAAQIETFWRRGNAVWLGTCANGLRNNVWYSVTLTANDNKVIWYSIRELAPGGQVFNYSVTDTENNQMSENLVRWWMGHVWSPPHDWNVSIMDIRNGWY